MVDAGVARGWAVDGAPGLVCTTDYDDRPVVRECLHWVVCEGIAAAWARYAVSGDVDCLAWYGRLWAYAREYLPDAEDGGWVHERSPENLPADAVWWGKPDVYHAYQATLVPLLPGMVRFAGAIHLAPRVG